MPDVATITPTAVLPERGTAGIFCLVYEESGSRRPITCDRGSVCMQLTTATPAVAYCQGQPPVTECFNPQDLPKTNCNQNQACCTAGSTCGQYNINDGHVIMRFCSSTSISIDGINPAFLGYNPSRPTATAARPTKPTSTSTSSGGSSDLGVGIGVIVGGVVLLGLSVWFLWWFCCIRRKNSWWNLRNGRYAPIPEPANIGAPAPYVSGSHTSLPVQGGQYNMNFPMGPVATPPVMSPPVDPGPPARPTSTLEWKSSDPPKTLTFRVEYIPMGFSVEDVRNRLFSLPDRLRVTVRSLAPSLGAQQGTKTATIEYPSLIKNSNGPTLSGEARELNIRSLDPGFQGWTPLNHPAEPVYADVIAVTGLAGHAFGSWAVEHQQMWLRDFLPSEVPHIRVMTYGYNSQLTETLSRQDFDQHAEDFAEGLQALWESNYYQRPTILIGHSLGCLIIKQALILSRGWKGRPEKLEHIVPLLIFMGAPHNGLANSALMTLVKGKASESLIEELGPGSPTLRNLRFKFDDIAQNIRVLSIFERRETPTAIEKNGKWVREGPPVMMVEKQNAVTYLPHETRISADTDHRGISKLRHTDGGTYGPIKRAIGNVLDNNYRGSMVFE